MLEKSTFQGVPKLAGTNEWTTSRHSIRELLSGRSFAHFVLCFYVSFFCWEIFFNHILLEICKLERRQLLGNIQISDRFGPISVSGNIEPDRFHFFLPKFLHIYLQNGQTSFFNFPYFRPRGNKFNSFWLFVGKI